MPFGRDRSVGPLTYETVPACFLNVSTLAGVNRWHLLSLATAAPRVVQRRV